MSNLFGVSLALQSQSLQQHVLPPKTLMGQLSASSSDPSMALNYSFGGREGVPCPQPLPVLAITSRSQDQGRGRLENLRKLECKLRRVVTNLNQKKNALLAHRAQLAELEQQLAKREASLRERESELQGKDAELNEGFSDLAKIEHELDELFRGLAGVSER
ncbi:TPA: hypothetical protein SMR47_000165 [Pseudomonas putida]|nr:hypothetical protein [Pseudomonas putida]